MRCAWCGAEESESSALAWLVVNYCEAHVVDAMDLLNAVLGQRDKWASAQAEIGGEVGDPIMLTALIEETGGRIGYLPGEAPDPITWEP